MSKDEPTQYIKASDFASVYADGAIFQLTDTFPRLVFYRKEMEVIEDTGEIEKTKDRVTLRFEVRLSEYTLKELADNISEIITLKEKAFKMEQKNKRRKGVLTSWYDLNTKIERFIYNTDEDEIDRKQIDDLSEQYEDLRVRTAKRVKANQKAEGANEDG